MPRPGTRTVALGPAKLSECQQIASISRRTIESGLAWRWRSARVAEQIRDEDSAVVVAREGDRVVGFAAMSFRFEDRDAHLLLLGVVPGHRRAGIGSRLYDWLEVMARRSGVRRVCLEVRDSAMPAHGFYASRGFAEKARIAGYYQGREDARRLEKRLA
jgi:ribosomal-protein-alanine N-acetyltransferase